MSSPIGSAADHREVIPPIITGPAIQGINPNRPIQHEPPPLSLEQLNTGYETERIHQIDGHHILCVNTETRKARVLVYEMTQRKQDALLLALLDEAIRAQTIDPCYAIEDLQFHLRVRLHESNKENKAYPWDGPSHSE